VFQHANGDTPHGLGYLIQRPQSHAIHHQRGVHAFNYADLPLWDMVFGTFRNPPRSALTPLQGFHDGASARIAEMLLFRDVSGAPRRS
jgi:sterol desaturase/sphingolipid hydroxylase (fatty acid hydroxylase superfamily)